MADAQHPPEVDRAAASRRAVEARRARASLKRDVAMRVITPQELVRRAFAEPTSPAGTMRVTEFLTSIPAIGEGKRDRILDAARHLAGQAARRARRAPARARSRRFLDERWPEPSPRAGRSRLVVLAGPDRRRQGHRRRTHQRAPPRDPPVGSATTRAPRPGEVDGEHYFFVDDAEFDRLVATASCSSTRRCTTASATARPRAPIEQALAEGRTVLLEIDLQGARQVRAAEPSATLVFLLPPSWDELVQRLVGRGHRGRRGARAAAAHREDRARRPARVRFPRRERRRRRAPPRRSCSLTR